MAVIWFTWTQKSGSEGEDYAREYSRTALVKCDQESDNELQIWANPNCPKLYGNPDFDPYSFCVKREAKLRPKTRYLWDLSFDFSTQRPQAIPSSDNPMDDPVEVSMDTVLQSEKRYTDIDGNPTCNTAGDLIEFTLDIPRTVIQIQRNIPYGSGWVKDIAGIINSAPCKFKGTTFEAGTLKFFKASISATKFDRNIAYDVCQLEIRHKEEGWVSTALNTGFYELVYNTGKVDKKGNDVPVKRRCVDSNGEPTSEPCFLDENGTRPEMEIENPLTRKIEYFPKTILDPSDIIILTFNHMRFYDFNQLPIR